MTENREITEQLLNEMEKLSEDGMLPLERRLLNTAVWFHRNRGRLDGTDLQRRLDFLEKVLDIFMELFALTVDRMQKAEGRPQSAKLWMPRGHTVNL